MKKKLFVNTLQHVLHIKQNDNDDNNGDHINNVDDGGDDGVGDDYDDDNDSDGHDYDSDQW